MTDRITALRALEKAVEAGNRWETWGTTDCPMRLSSIYARNAFNGSLDAAKALHDAVLPWCNQYTIDEGPSGCGAHIVCWPDGLSGERQLEYKGYAETPSRAWLIAIIRAMIAQEGGE